MTLTEFLLARIAEDAAEARRDIGKGRDDPAWVFAWQTPDRLLAECVAKRRIVEELVSMNTSALDDDPDLSMAAAHTAQGLFYAASALAFAYADHPDYREEWAA